MWFFSFFSFLNRNLFLLMLICNNILYICWCQYQILHGPVVKSAIIGVNLQAFTGQEIVYLLCVRHNQNLPQLLALDQKHGASVLASVLVAVFTILYNLPLCFISYLFTTALSLTSIIPLHIHYITVLTGYTCNHEFIRYILYFSVFVHYTLLM